MTVALRNTCGLFAVGYGLLHLCFALIAATPDWSHVDARPPGLPQYLAVALLSSAGAMWIAGGFATLATPRWHRRGLLVIAGASGAEALVLLAKLASHQPFALVSLLVCVSSLGMLAAWLVRRCERGPSEPSPGPRDV
ncbi:hypothetical protein A7982_13816 [Minicystis rosea]|nr:hypothetical protein A7982_13816 [Minicystis rosea]